MKTQFIAKTLDYFNALQELLEPEVVVAIILFIVFFLFIPLCFLYVFFKLRKLVLEMNQVVIQLKAVSDNIEHLGLSLIEFLSVYRIDVEKTQNHLSNEEYVPSAEVEMKKVPTSVLKNIFKVLNRQ